MTKVISKFENLPNELLLDIFTYCRPRDLFISLFNLNQRLNTLIYLQSLGVDLGNALPKYLLDIHYQSVLPNAREQIISLRLSDTYNRMKRFVANDDDLGIEFETRKAILQHVRCLILWDPTMNSLYEALKYVNNLESFHLTSIGRARQTPNYSDSLLKILFQMKTLKRLYLALHDSIIYNTDFDINTSITHLVLNGCHMQHFGPLLRHLPNIQTLNIMCYNRPNLLSWTHQNFDHSLYDGLSERIPYLTNLTLHVTHTPFFEIEVILRQLPKLIKFSFSSLLIEDYSNGANWERVITNSLPVLNRFCLFINETHVPLRTPIDLDKMIESFSSPFWYRWPVVIEYYNEGFSKRHLMLYTLPMQKDSVRTYLYGAQTYSTQKSVNTNDPVENEERKNDYKKVYELHFVLHPSPPANVLLPNRVYTNLKSLSFTSELTDPRSYDCDVVLTDLQKLFSSSILANIKRIYLYNQIYPNNFFSKLLNILPNVQSVRVPDALLYISTVSPRITSLTIDFTSSSVVSNFTDILRQMGTYLLNLRYLYLELKDAQNIYIFLAYCLRKLQHLLDIHLAFHETNACIDQQTFLTWFTDYKSLNALNSKVQVEFSDKNNRLHISL